MKRFISCFKPSNQEADYSNDDPTLPSTAILNRWSWGCGFPVCTSRSRNSNVPTGGREGANPNQVTSFRYRDLVRATQNFRADWILGEGGFGSVHKGQLSTGEEVAVKRLNLNGPQGKREFSMEVFVLGIFNHPNIIKLIGYCVHCRHYLLVYEFMPLGSLQDHLFDVTADKVALDWNTRMRIAAGIARGLQYLHYEANPRVIYRDLKSSNILLDHGFLPKLSDFGLAKLGPAGYEGGVAAKAGGTLGYCDPDYAQTRWLTYKSDVYSFGVVLLEIITGIRVYDRSRPPQDRRYLLQWLGQLSDQPQRFPEMADPLLEGRYPRYSCREAVALAARCVEDRTSRRPEMAEVVSALEILASRIYNTNYQPPNPAARHMEVGETSAAAEARGRSSVPVRERRPTAAGGETSAAAAARRRSSVRERRPTAAGGETSAAAAARGRSSVPQRRPTATGAETSAAAAARRRSSVPERRPTAAGGETSAAAAARGRSSVPERRPTAAGAETSAAAEARGRSSVPERRPTAAGGETSAAAAARGRSSVPERRPTAAGGETSAAAAARGRSSVPERRPTAAGAETSAAAEARGRSSVPELRPTAAGAETSAAAEARGRSSVPVPESRPTAAGTAAAARERREQNILGRRSCSW